MRSQHRLFIPTGLLACISLAGCLTNTPDPATGGIYACVDDLDCPGEQECLQKVCEAVKLPVLQIQNPESEEKYLFGNANTDILSVSGANLILRSRSASNEPVPGEGHLVVFINGQEAAVIDSGDISAGVLANIDIPNTPGAHRIVVQARLNDGTDYDNETAQARRIVWVDDGREHVALRKPWPGDVFGLDSQVIEAEVVTLGGIEIGPPQTMREHVHVYYDAPFPGCLIDNPMCEVGYNGVVPSDEDAFGPVLLPASSAGMVSLTAVVATFDHLTYEDDLGEPVFSAPIMILRSDAQ
ncbi:hypothetical protein DB30_04320 [Enhygromyxa salina]|uniref:Uncharacterized protein n=1 Tax=Enhygromyxa salina TaxID=215803 RepID=A0A0C1ZFX8_9BACT|nr:hypothetical protein [Enhygromyxa salina]KIG16549.1 hypothetical protein DB30_04320 [Enhygromyxa salina]